MNGFLAGCLWVFAVCAALGMVPAAVLAAGARSFAAVLLACAVAVFVIVVLVSAAAALP